MRRFYRIASLLVVVVMIFTFAQMELVQVSSTVHAEGKVSEDSGDSIKDSIVLYVGSSDALVNNKQVPIDISNQMVKPIIKDERTLVPLRFIAENMGAEVEWEEAKSRATVKIGEEIVSVTLGSNIMKVNGNEVFLEVPAQSISSRTYIPLRALAEAFDKKVFYDKGLIIVSSIEDILDPKADKEKIDSLISQLNNLPVLGSYEKLKELFAGMSTREGDYRVSVFSRDTVGSNMKADVAIQAESAAAAQAPENSQKPEYSQTNVQVQGVDEADVVKTDGEYIYQVNKQRIVIVKGYPADEMKLQATLEFTDKTFSPSEMYLHDNKLVVIGCSYNNVYNNQGAGDIKTKSGFYNPYYARSKVKAAIFDISDKSSIKQLREVELEGNYISSRKIGSQLYMVINRNIDYYAANGNEDTVLPAYRDTSVGEEFATIGFDEIRYFPDMVGSNYMLVAGIDIDDAEKAADIQAYLGSGNNIYASEQNLYVISSSYRQRPVRPAKPAAGEGVTVMPALMPEYSANTSVYKFSLAEGKSTYLTKGEVPGRVLNQFSMDEHNKYFRIATTIDNWNTSGRQMSTNNLYVLDEMLNMTGKLEDVAPGEKIYSVRFMGNRAYMVTFKTVDPLFVIDVKDPKNPFILGALKIPGYSNYLHPYDENHIIGFGKDTMEVVHKDAYGRETGRSAYQLGMKLAIFDVTDVENPIEKYAEKIGDRGTESPILSNHKALLFDKSKNLLAFPVSVAEVKGQSAEPLQYGQLTFQGAYVYNIDLQKGLQLRGKVTHLSGEEYLKSGYDKYYGDKSIERLLYIGDNLYSLSQGMIKANSINDLKELGEVVIP